MIDFTPDDGSLQMMKLSLTSNVSRANAALMVTENNA